jgi:hypothetical protein
MRWTRDRSGAAECFEGEFVAGGMGGDYTSRTTACKAPREKMGRPEVKVETRPHCLTVNA